MQLVLQPGANVVHEEWVSYLIHYSPQTLTQKKNFKNFRKNLPTLFENGLKFLKSFVIIYIFVFLYKLMFRTRMILYFMFCSGWGWVAWGGR